MKLFALIIFYSLITFNVNAQKIYVNLSTGGPYGNGGLFRINPDGTDPDYYMQIEDVPAGNISTYAGLVKHPNGKVYGVTSSDQNYTNGVFYEVDPISRSIRNIASFSDYTINNPKGHLFVHSNGKVYGITDGTTYGSCIFSYDPSIDLFKIEFKFGPFSYHSNFATPATNVVRDSQGYNYYATKNTGRFAKGNLIRYDDNGNYDVIHQFRGMNFTNQDGPLILQNNTIFIGGGAAIGKFDIPSGKIIDSLVFDDIGADFYFDNNLTIHDDGYLYAQMTDITIFHEWMLKIDPTDFSYTLTDLGDQNVIGNFYNSSLISMDGKLYTAANTGGSFGLGSLAEYNPTNGSFTILHDFDGSDTDSPSKMVRLNHKLYGLSTNGIFAYDQSNNYNFLPNTSGFDGLFVCSNNELTVSMEQGGEYFSGAIFKLDTITFDTTTIKNISGSIEGLNLNFYQEITPGKWLISTSGGAKYGEGAMSVYDETFNSFMIVKDHIAYEIEGDMSGGMIEMNGDIYGVSSGGYQNLGFIYRFDVEYGYAEAMGHFSTATGTNPKGGLILGNDGFLYGMTYDGGSTNRGTIYQVDTSDFSIIKKFDFTGNPNGSNPISQFAKGDNGKLYGLSNGIGGGSLFEYDPASGNVVLRMTFDNNSGYDPRGSLLHTGSNIFYGLTYTGSPTSVGSLFKFDANNNLLTVVQNLSTSTTGANPISTPIIGEENSIYYTTQGRFSYYDTITDVADILFLYDQPNNGYFTGEQFMNNGKLHQFAERFTDQEWMTIYGDDWSGPSASFYQIISKSDTLGITIIDLIKANDGQIYITTAGGGANNMGTILRMDPNSYAVEKLYDLSSLDQCSNGFDNIIEVNGKFYMTGYPAPPDLGNIYMFDPITNIVTLVHELVLSEGDVCYGLTLGADGLVYGVTTSTTNYGRIFSIDPSNQQFTLEYFLNSGTGNWMEGNPVTASDGKIYGVMKGGGLNSEGVIFCYDPVTANYQIKHSFSTLDGNNPTTELKQIGNLLVGISTNAGVNSSGNLFTYNFITDSFSVIHDFVNTNIYSPFSFYIDNGDGFSFTGNNDTITICEGANIILTAPHTNEAVSYQWLLNGNIISGANNDTLIISSVNIPNSGTYELEAMSSSGATLSPYIFLQVNSCDSVYPGDTDVDGLVSMNDLLPIGTNFGEVGPVRIGASILWEGQFANDWATLLPNGLNAKHADANGDGIINLEDTLAITTNFGNTHPLFAPEEILQRSTQQIDIRSSATSYLAGQTMDFFVSIGTSVAPANDIYGVTFDVEINPSLIQTSTFYSNFPADFPGVDQSNLIWLDKWNPGPGITNVGIVRLNHTDTSGFNDVYHFSVDVSNSILTSQTLNVTLTSVNIIDASGTPYQITGNHSLAITLNSSNSVEIISNDSFNIYPNPSKNKFYITSKIEVPESATITDLTGKIIKRVKINKGMNQLDLSEFSSGIYFLNISGNTFKLFKD